MQIRVLPDGTPVNDLHQLDDINHAIGNLLFAFSVLSDSTFDLLPQPYRKLSDAVFSLNREDQVPVA